MILDCLLILVVNLHQVMKSLISSIYIINSYNSWLEPMNHKLIIKMKLIRILIIMIMLIIFYKVIYIEQLQRL